MTGVSALTTRTPQRGRGRTEVLSGRLARGGASSPGLPEHSDQFQRRLRDGKSRPWEAANRVVELRRTGAYSQSKGRPLRVRSLPQPQAPGDVPGKKISF